MADRVSLDVPTAKRIVRRLVILIAFAQFYAWLDFLISNRQPAFFFSPYGIPITIFIAGWAIFWCVLMAVKARRFTWTLAIAFLNAFLLNLVDFASLYFHFGTTSNFSTTLSRLDAIYFTLGTMTTAGTGSITPESQLARGLVSVQMGLDIALLVVAAAVVITRLGERN